jgi:hypothetical protein
MASGKSVFKAILEFFNAVLTFSAIVIEGKNRTATA